MLLALFGCSDAAPSASPASRVSAATTPPPSSTTIDMAEHPFATPPAPDLRGRLLSGESVVISTSLDGLCLVIGDDDYGCDSSGPVGAPGAPLEQPRIALAQDIGPMMAESEAGVLAYAYLPENAVAVVGLDRQGRRIADRAFTNERLWGLPIEPGQTPFTFAFLDGQGQEIDREPSPFLR